MYPVLLLLSCIWVSPLFAKSAQPPIKRCSVYSDCAIYSTTLNQKLVDSEPYRLTLLKIEDTQRNNPIISYQYNRHGEITQRNYLDSAFNYEYNPDGTLKKVSARFQPETLRQYATLFHTKEKTISNYHYRLTEKGKPQVYKEIQHVYADEDLQLKSPKATYIIGYLYNDQQQLIKRIKTHQDELNKNSVIYQYSYHQDQLLTIYETHYQVTDDGKTIQTEYLVDLTYNENKDISSLTHIKNGKIQKHTSYQYDYDSPFRYSVFYADPVKEWRYDLDVLALNFSTIKSIKITEFNQSGIFHNEYQYTYHNANNPFADKSPLIRQKLNVDIYLYRDNAPLTHNRRSFDLEFKTIGKVELK